MIELYIIMKYHKITLLYGKFCIPGYIKYIICILCKNLFPWQTWKLIIIILLNKLGQFIEHNITCKFSINWQKPELLPSSTVSNVG